MGLKKVPSRLNLICDEVNGPPCLPAASYTYEYISTGPKSLFVGTFFRFILCYIHKMLETQIEGLLVCRHLQTCLYERV